jgi:hypothetical protein
MFGHALLLSAVEPFRPRSKEPLVMSSKARLPDKLKIKDSGSMSQDLPEPKGYLISCDIPTKQFIQYLDELKPQEKKFILADLDPTHLLVKQAAKEEITAKVEEWLDQNVFSAVERVGEDLATV